MTTDDQDKAIQAIMRRQGLDAASVTPSADGTVTIRPIPNGEYRSWHVAPDGLELARVPGGNVYLGYPAHEETA